MSDPTEEQSLASLSQKAEEGDAEAQYEIGVKLLASPASFDDAFRWLQKSAEKQHVGGTNALGGCYYKGFGVDKDAGHLDAQYFMGEFYCGCGDIVPQNFSMAARWFGKAAEQGQADTQERLAVAYVLGEGVQKDQPRAVELWKQAAAQGNLKAICQLARCYNTGEGTEKDLEAEVECMTTAAERGHLFCQVHLGHYFQQGIGVEQSDETAVEWLKKKPLTKEIQTGGIDWPCAIETGKEPR